ncbi:MAG: hypothetical protein WBB29_11180 [Geitlerinemataceae cyanobacterium]
MDTALVAFDRNCISITIEMEMRPGRVQQHSTETTSPKSEYTELGTT